jgi:hypothetical protein
MSLAPKAVDQADQTPDQASQEPVQEGEGVVDLTRDAIVGSSPVINRVLDMLEKIEMGIRAARTKLAIFAEHHSKKFALDHLEHEIHGGEGGIIQDAKITPAGLEAEHIAVSTSTTHLPDNLTVRNLDLCQGYLMHDLPKTITANLVEYHEYLPQELIVSIEELHANGNIKGLQKHPISVVQAKLEKWRKKKWGSHHG